MEQLLITVITVTCSIISAVAAAFGIVKSVTDRQEKQRREHEERQEALLTIILNSLDGTSDSLSRGATAICIRPYLQCRKPGRTSAELSQRPVSHI